MTATARHRPKLKKTAPADDPDLPGQLSALAAEVIRYARRAKIQHFRYCRRPSAPDSPHATLLGAIAALHAELRSAQQRPTCQTSAADLLKELAALGHQPPCQSKTEQQTAAQIINRALLELR